MKISKSEFDSILRGVGAIAKVEAAKAVAPVQAKVSALEVENAVLRAAIKDLREKVTLGDISPSEMVRRFDAMQ